METKEAKEYVKTIDIEEAIKVFKILIRDRKLFRLMDSEVDFYCKVVEFLKQGEENKKYKLMWGEARDWFQNNLDLDEYMNDFEQKYFPKENADVNNNQ